MKIKGTIETEICVSDTEIIRAAISAIDYLSMNY
jgi:hypothetical protein